MAEPLEAPQHMQRAAHRGLFAPPSRPATLSAAEIAEPEAAGPAMPRASLFGIVTGPFRRARPATAQLAETVEPIGAPGLHDMPEPPRASVRVAAGEEMGLDIPAFLRRQSS
ncbi:MAG: hypothetical protein JO047_13395 [Alphaproteobacteria bacterium]|nr:hypothetical protein [Alphaproteobacteria bacterium]